MKEAFALFDTDGDGTISIVELSNVMKSLGRTLSRSRLKEMIAIADTSHSFCSRPGRSGAD